MKKYLVWLWQNTRDIRWNMLVRIVAGIGRVAFGLLMVWLCKRFIDVTIRTGTTDDILQNADRIREARASQGLVIVEKVGASRLNAVFDEADKLVAADVPVLGWVVIE